MLTYRNSLLQNNQLWPLLGDFHDEYLHQASYGMSWGGRSGAAMRDRVSKLPGPKGGPEREEQVRALMIWMVLFAAEDHVKLYCDGDLPTSTTLMMLMDAGSRNNGAPTSPGTDEAGPPTISRQRSQQ